MSSSNVNVTAQGLNGLALDYCLWILAALFTAIVVPSIIDTLKRYRKLVDVPVINLRGWSYDTARKLYNTNFKDLVEEGFRKYPGKIFQLWSPEGYLVILPPQFIQDLQGLPQDHADLAAAVEERFVGTYKWTRFTSAVNNRATHQNLIPRLGVLIPSMVEETKFCVEGFSPNSKDWTPVKIQHAFVRIVAQISSRAFVGSDICRNKAWLDASIQYTLDAFVGSMKLRKWQLALRPFVAHLLPETKRLYAHHALARQLLEPVIKSRYEKQKSRDYKKPVDMIQWIMDQADAEPSPPSAAVQAELQMLIGMAGIHTTTLTATQTLLELSSRPEYIEPLREEARSMMAAAGGTPQKKDLAKLVLLDSFIKESQRLNPPDMLTFDRVIQTPLTLPNGVHLPKGTRLGVPAAHISWSDEVWPNASQFDGFRFAKLREAKKDDIGRETGQHQFVTTSSTEMHFGHGRFACPGRFFAAAELKLIFVFLLLRYDIKSPEPGRRPPNTPFGSMITVDTEAEVLFRLRSHDSLDIHTIPE